MYARYDTAEIVVPLVIGAVLIAIFVAAVFALRADAKEWQAFKDANHCEARGYIDGHTNVGYGLTANGKMGTVITSTPRKTRWVCDNGVEIYR